MRGHRQIERARAHGLAPRMVFVVVGACPAHPVFPVDADMWHDALPQVWTDGTAPEVADLRWMRGLAADLTAAEGSADELLVRWFGALTDAGADIRFIVTADMRTLLPTDLGVSA